MSDERKRQKKKDQKNRQAKVRRRKEHARERDRSQAVRQKWPEVYQAAAKWSEDMDRKADARPLRKWRQSELDEAMTWIQSQLKQLTRQGCPEGDQPFDYSLWMGRLLIELKRRFESYGLIPRDIMAKIVESDRRRAESVKAVWKFGEMLHGFEQRGVSLEEIDFPPEASGVPLQEEDIREERVRSLTFYREYPNLTDALEALPLGEDLITSGLKTEDGKPTPAEVHRQYAFTTKVFGKERADEDMMSFWDGVSGRSKSFSDDEGE
jgi:hypothetical protein